MRTIKRLLFVVVAAICVVGVGVARDSVEIYRPSNAQREYRPITVKHCLLRQEYGGKKTKTSKTRIMNNMVGYEPISTDEYTATTNRYGSSLHLPRQRATGRFYVKQIDGRWWFVDPEGYLNIRRGVNSVRLPKGFAESRPEFMGELLSLGITGVGAFSGDYAHVREYNQRHPEHPIAYAPSFNFVVGARRSAGLKYPNNNDFEYMAALILYKEFGRAAKEYAKSALKPYVEDKNVIGIFSDNEIPFITTKVKLLRKMLSIPEQDNQARLAAVKFMRKHGLEGSVKAFDNAPNRKQLNEEFTGMVAERYYKCCREAIKSVDKDFLYIGSRLHSLALRTESIVRAAGRYCDVVSFNYYTSWGARTDIHMNKWEQWSSRPFMIGEFYACGLDSGLPTNTKLGAGWVVATQQERGYFYQHMALGLLEAPQCVGWDWFACFDADGSIKRNNGIFTSEGVLYREFATYIRELNSNVYKILDYYKR